MAEVKEEVQQEVQQDAEVQQGGTKRAREGEALKLGYAEFPNVKTAKDFFKNLLSKWIKNVDLNEYEHMALLDLLKHHPDHERKMGLGVRGFQVRTWKDKDGQTKQAKVANKDQTEEVRAFHVIRKDGSVEDFSYLKCLSELFPGEVTIHHGKSSDANKRARNDSGGRGGRGGGRGGRGRGGRGRGGRR